MLRVTIGLTLLATAVWGQSPSAPHFEVASIKPSVADSANSGGKSAKGRLVMSNVTLKRCIMGAYGIGPNEIAGGPDWLDSDRFEIVAKADEVVGDKALMEMLQTLLAERFQLTMHREMRPVRAFILEVAKSGPKLEKSTSEESSTLNGRGSIVAKGTTMKRFASVLSRQMDLPVVDRTGLEGSFDMKLQWTPEGSKPDAESGPTIFTALQEQLGLRLQAEKTPIEVLVIDRAEKPTEN
jgi:uncharacterized protein (TIGR03435 family)